MDSPFFTPFARSSTHKIIFVTKIGLMASGIYKFIESFYLLFGTMHEIEFYTFVLYNLIAIMIVFGAAIAMFLICAYLFKYFKSYFV